MTDRATLVAGVADLVRFNHDPIAIANEAIDLIRAEVLEEAAMAAEYRCGTPEWSADTNSGYECAAKEIAAAIRSLKGGI